MCYPTFKMGNFKCRTLYLLLASTWGGGGLCPPQSVSLLGHAPSPRPPSYRLAQAIFEPNLSSRINNPTISSRLFFLLTPPMKMEESVPKRRHIKFRRRGITQKKEYDIFTVHLSTSAWGRIVDFKNYFFLLNRCL
jgi:hypothetical protein